MAIIERLLYLGIAGALGTLARYGLSGLVQRYVGSAFPWGTFVVNVVGCFLFGAIWSLSNERLALSGEAKILILTGFMGAFTTFSTLIADSSILMADSQWIQGLGNILMHSVVGIVAFFVGLAIIRVV